MPLNTQVLRNGKPVTLPWQGREGDNMMLANQIAEITLNVFLTVAMIEGDPDLEYAPGKKFGDLEPPTFVRLTDTGVYYIETKCPLWHGGKLTLSRDFEYHFDAEGETEDLVLSLKQGDVLKMWRT